MDQEFVVNYSIVLIVVIVSIAILLLLIIAFFRILKLRQKLGELDKENGRIITSYDDMESMYKSAINSYNTLNTHYEDLHKSSEGFKKLAYTDLLTELPNRVAFTEMLNHIMLTIRSDEIIGIIDIDIDNFKNINDTLGHSYGDELLIDVTHRLKQVTDENDYLARIGGDEFIILTQNLEDMASYEEKIKKIRNVFTFPFVLSTKEYFVTVSIGVAFAPKDGKTAQSLIKNVDSAMYMAKANGKNTYTYFDPDFNKMLTDKIELQSELRKAIENDEFKLFYQAQMDLANKGLIGFEALIRWEHPNKGLLIPRDFMSLAEESGLIIPIGEWVLRTACYQLKEWSDIGYTNFTMAVNLSSRQFKDRGFVQMVYGIIEETGIDPSRLELEITETVALEDLEYTIEIIKELKTVGVSFSLDDFGTGYSAMSYLKHLPISNLKIDKSFLDLVMEDNRDKKIIQAIITLAKSLNLHVIAEGVEKPEQEQFLMESECDVAQGYLYSKPVPKERAEEILINMTSQ
ncbi:MAG: EAL domain-containing protein [Clostridiales bacterium]|jgi:polar amino acid transport system substrate-binding protein|nr:EAL domain-containing protein [Bacillota bacterium]NLK04591.1 EAL domain-containing protein [Clostridiales bacterium]